MTIAIEFDTIEARDAFLRESPPEGLSFYIEAANEGGIVTTVFTLFADIAKHVPAILVAHWIFERLKKHPAKRVTVDGQEPVDEAEFERFIVSDLEIGKND